MQRLRLLYLLATLCLYGLSGAGCANDSAAGAYYPFDMGSPAPDGDDMGSISAPLLALSSPALLDVSDGQRSLAVADLDNDGLPEIFVTLPYQGKLGMLWNSGSGKFETHLISVPGAPYGLALADVNGDMTPDIAYTDSTAGNLYVLLLNQQVVNRNQPFASTTKYPLKPGAAVVQAGLLHGNKDPDLAVLNIMSGDIDVFVNGGAAAQYGFVQHPVRLLSGTSYFSLAVLAGRVSLAADLVLTNATADTLTLLRNDKQGNMGLASGPTGTVATPPGPIFVTTAPTAGVSDPTVYVASSSSNQLAPFASALGVLSPQPMVSLAMAAHPVAVAVGDLNGDSYPDLVVANNGNDTMALLLGSQSGSYTAMPMDYYPASQAPVAVAIADLKGNNVSQSRNWEN